MSWFEVLTGFREISPDQVRENIVVEGDTLISRVNRQVFIYGRLEIVSLGELRKLVNLAPHSQGQLSVREVVADVSDLHTNESNAGCLFQVASQFNLLEMLHPNLTPEDGIGIYERDFTQGPTCAIAAGGGTIYRNYFVPVNGQLGQSVTNQIDCLADIGIALNNSEQRLWEMRNGYALASRQGIIEISRLLKASSEPEIDQLRQLLQIGVQWNTQVTIKNSKHTVTQVYCSALPIAYCTHSPTLWANFAQLILDASYEATICSAILNSLSTQNNTVFLTLLGGGAFGNQIDWILGAIKRALKLYRHWNLDIAIVSYGRSKPYIQELIAQFSH